MSDIARPASLLRFARAVLSRKRLRPRPVGATVAPAGETERPATVEPAKIHIPLRESSPDASDCESLRLAGRYLARQEDWETLAERLREADTARAATRGGTPIARLLAEGANRIAQKLGEEAVETVIAGATENRSAVISESADLLYHLLVLWAASDIAPGEVWAELAHREGRSGLDEIQGRSA